MLAPRGVSAVGWAMLALGPMVNAFESALYACPAPCQGVWDDWTVYQSLDRIQYCEEPMLMDFSLDPATGGTKVYSCASTAQDVAARSLDSASGSHLHARGHHGNSHERLHRRDSSATCIQGEEATISLDFSLDSTTGEATADDLNTILDHVEKHLTNPDHCDTSHIFGYHNGAVVGVYIGSAIDNVETTSSLFKQLRGEVSTTDETPKSLIMQRCSDVYNSNYIVGVAVDTTGDLNAVQKSVYAWSKAQCAASPSGQTNQKDISIHERALGPALPAGNATTTLVERAADLWKRGDCKTTNVTHGDTCPTLAKNCGISIKDFDKYNDADDKFCNNLIGGQQVCCSEGDLPDIRPKPSKDGSCATHKVTSVDDCSKIAASYGLKKEDISDFNDGSTWGWTGCDPLQLGLEICVSKGDPPMPAPVSNAQCGPTVAGTKKPTNGTQLADLNPCPLNSCCDVWGQCGITPNYCTNVTGPTGNPGTAPKHHNGCISNCGTNITNNEFGPNGFTKIGYYESWNWDRPCLNMRAGSVGVVDYSHIHWAFASITDDFDVHINDTYNQWDDFLNLQMVRRIISFGGWGYSTSPETYQVLRKAMDPKNVDTFVENIFNFVEKHKLDGIDFDWEYPGAPDIPGIPPGLDSDGANYLAFLKKMKENFPFVKTISMAVPASYWYLKAFPIKEMAEVVDYIVYMTYDLHGQWDSGRQWTQEGCTSGTCLYSQVNLTETEYSLAMLTKAGVSTNMVYVGVPSYGRSFGMADKDCTDPSCHFTGSRDHSNAAPGRCTKTPGIIANAEIYEILTLEEQDKVYYDGSSDSNIIVWNNTWAAFMDSDTLISRTNYYKKLQFAGTVDWAADLKQFTGDDGNRDGDFGDPPAPDLGPCDATFDSIEDLGDSGDSIPQHCAAQYILQTLSAELDVAMKNYTDLMDDGYDGKFKTYAKAVAGNADKTVHDWIYDHGNDYFTCEVAEDPVCCSWCHDHEMDFSNCRYCWTDGDCTRDCTGLNCGAGGSGMTVPNARWVNVSEPCPPDYSKRGQLDSDQHKESVFWTLPDDKADKFWKDLYDATAVSKKHMKIGNYDRGNDCTPADSMGDGDQCWTLGYDYEIPITDDYSADDVADPKDTAKKGLDRSGNLTPQIKKALFQMSTDTWIGDGMDLVDSVSMPILMVAHAVEQMGTVADVADEIDEAQKQAIIAGFLGALLFMIPIAGEILGSIEELADVGAVLSLAGDVGNAAMGVSDIVKDPDNAPLAIMDLLFVPGSLADAASIAKAAKYRREMKPENVAKLGEKVSGRLDSIKKVTGKCYL
ncbi:hypothetical protein FE257_006534 [Aspergillus nanangensis]|uniref:chitinase n=1 Tax=Aspergillus nanangensis TaxID=2582783 RepID=A0AAD4CXP2_ASPNN|nr:hypothetical protein FE257_006534 [Aspergillus nanangensis]